MNPGPATSTVSSSAENLSVPRIAATISSGHFARIFLLRLGDLQRDVGCNVSVRFDLRPLKRDWNTGHAKLRASAFDQADELFFMRGKHRDAQGAPNRAKPRSLLSKERH